VLCILQRFATPDVVSSTLNRVLTTLALIKSRSLQEVSRDSQTATYWELGLDVWLYRKHSPSLETSINKWVFFYNVLELGSQLRSGLISFKVDSESLSFQYHSKDTVQKNIITVLINELERDVSVIDTLDVIAQGEQLPFSGLSVFSQNMVCVAAVLLLMLYNTLTERDSNKFLASGSDASLLCKVLLCCSSVWVKGGLPHTGAERILSQPERNGKKTVTLPILDAELLLGIKRRLYSILNTVTSCQVVSVPDMYITSVKDCQLGQCLLKMRRQVS